MHNKLQWVSNFVVIKPQVTDLLCQGLGTGHTRSTVFRDDLRSLFIWIGLTLTSSFLKFSRRCLVSELRVHL